MQPDQTAMVGLQHLPPQNIEAEQMVLGACMIEPRAVLGMARVTAEDFYKSAHGRIYSAIRRVWDSREDVDLVTVCDAIQKNGGFGEVGGASYLATLVSLVPTAANFKSHEKLVIDAATRRRVIRACALAEKAAYDLEEPDRVIADCISALNAARMASVEESAMPYSRIINLGFEAIERNYETFSSGKLPGIPTGFAGIDQLTNGFQKNWFYVFAGRTGRGKTSLAMQMARAAAKSGRTVGVVSVEMDPEQLAIREISSESQVPIQRLASGRMLDADWAPVSAAAGTLSPLKIWGLFSAFTSEAVERGLNYLVQIHGCELVFVDYLQLLSIERHSGTREQEVSAISRMHKRKAKELHIPVVALAQLNRGIENRVDKKPALSDLRESGAIEQDADVVAFVHQDECKCDKAAHCFCGRRYTAWYLQRKGRMNATGDVELRWDGRTTTFRDVTV